MFTFKNIYTENHTLFSKFIRMEARLNQLFLIVEDMY